MPQNTSPHTIFLILRAPNPGPNFWEPPCGTSEPPHAGGQESEGQASSAAGLLEGAYFEAQSWGPGSQLEINGNLGICFDLFTIYTGMYIYIYVCTYFYMYRGR